MREIVQIHLTGEDRSGLSAALGELLAQAAANLLDIGQSVLHGQLSCALVVELPGERVASLHEALQQLAAEAALQLGFSVLSAQAYEQWRQAQGQARHVVTLLARGISAAQLQQVSAISARHGLNIERIERLSGRRAAQLPLGEGKACIELSVRGEPADAAALRSEFLAAAQALQMDVGFQRDSVYRRCRRLAVFDMDSTLIEAEVIDELAKAAGVGEQVAAITERAMRGELDFRASFKERLALLKGLSVDVLDDIAAQLRLTEGAETLFRELKRLGYKTAILSGGFSYFAEGLQRKLGIDYVFANALEIEDGRLTGVAQEPIVDAQRKADLLTQLAEQEGLSLEQTIAVGDGANDLPMLALAGLGVAFRAKPLVRQSAKQAITTLGLDGVLYLLGYHEREGGEWGE